MRIVVLGGSGFIGTRLVKRLLEAGHDVVIGDIRASETYPYLWRHCDVRDVNAVKEICEGTDVIYNLAAEHRDDVFPLSRYHEVNVDGARVVCEAAEATGIDHIIFTSSVAVYGLGTNDADECVQPRPFNEYGRTKLVAEGIYREWCSRSAGRRLVIVRPTVVIGEGNRGNFYQLARQIATGRFVMVGSGKNRKSMAYVENVAAFLEFGLGFGRGEHVYNYVDKPDLDMNSLVELIRTELGRAPRPPFKVPYWLGLLAGAGCDLLRLVTRRNFP